MLCYGTGDAAIGDDALATTDDVKPKMYNGFTLYIRKMLAEKANG